MKQPYKHHGDFKVPFVTGPLSGSFSVESFSGVPLGVFKPLFSLVVIKQEGG